jgi:hypothetical protein
MLMLGCLGQSRPTQDTDVVARAAAAVALVALAVIHTVDLPGTLGPTPLVGIGYLGIIAVAMVASGIMIVRSHWLAQVRATNAPPWPSVPRLGPGKTGSPVWRESAAPAGAAIG